MNTNFLEIPVGVIEDKVSGHLSDIINQDENGLIYICQSIRYFISGLLDNSNPRIENLCHLIDAILNARMSSLEFGSYFFSGKKYISLTKAV